MRLSSKLFLSFLPLLLIAIGFYFLLRKMVPHSPNEWLSTIDFYVKSKNYFKASKLLLQSKKSDLNLSRYDWLRILKRAYEISKYSKNYSVLEKASQRAVSKLPKVEEFWAFYTHSLLVQRKFKEAKKIVFNITSNKFSGLRNEAVLSTLYPLNQSPLQKAQDRLSESLDANYFQTIAEEIKSSVLFYDAAILWLKMRNLEHACAIFPQIALEKKIPLWGRIYISYNCQEVEKLEQILSEKSLLKDKNLFDVVFLQANLSLLKEQYSDAYTNYLKAKTLNPRGNWRIYQNLAVLNSRNKNFKDVIMFLEDGLRYFPMNKKLLLSYSFYLPNSAETLKFLDEYLIKYPLDPEINIRRIALSHQKFPQKTQSSLLWKLLENNQTSKNLVAYMIWFFLSNNSVFEARTVLEKYKKHGGNTNWSRYYEGYLLVAENKIEKALQFFKISDNEKGFLGKMWEIFYNQGIVYLYLKNYSAAFEAFTKAKNYYSDAFNGDSKKMLSIIYSQLAISSLKNHMDVLAVTFAKQALGLYTDNISAQRIIQTIKFKNTVLDHDSTQNY